MKKTILSATVILLAVVLLLAACAQKEPEQEPEYEIRQVPVGDYAYGYNGIDELVIGAKLIALLTITERHDPEEALYSARTNYKARVVRAFRNCEEGQELAISQPGGVVDNILYLATGDRLMEVGDTLLFFAGGSSGTIASLRGEQGRYFYVDGRIVSCELYYARQEGQDLAPDPEQDALHPDDMPADEVFAALEAEIKKGKTELPGIPDWMQPNQTQ